MDIPRDELVVITGLSGSGKSSLAFDTIYAEGQRRYVESLSAYARQFLDMMEKPDVDQIEGLSPAISIEQKSTSHNPRSTVGTVTEMYDYLRLLYARVGIPFCPEHGTKLEAQSISEMVDKTLAHNEGTAMMLLSPVVKERKGEHLVLMRNYLTQGFIRARINGEICDLNDPPKLELNKKHTIEIVVDRFKVKSDMKQRLAESFEAALKLSDGIAQIAIIDDNKTDELIFSEDIQFVSKTRPRNEFAKASVIFIFTNSPINEIGPSKLTHRLFSVLPVNWFISFLECFSTKTSWLSYINSLFSITALFSILSPAILLPGQF